MAQTGYTPISIYHSITGGVEPTDTNLIAGELALNIADGKLFYKDNAGDVQVLADKNSVGGVSTFSGGTTGLTPATATNGAITLAGTLAVANGGSGTTTATGTAGSIVLSVGPTITGIKEVRAAIAASNIDLSLGNYFSKTISGSTTFTVSNVPTTGTAFSFILDLTNAGSSVTWWSGVKWANGVAPTLTTSGRDSLGFYTYDGGTTWSGFVLGKDMK